MNKTILPLNKNQFLQESLRSLPRLLGQQDRNIGTLTYGSFDRNHWLSKTADVSNARNQEAIYTLTLIFCHEFDGNIYYKNPFPHPGVIIEINTLKKVGGFNIELYQCMDYELFIRLLLKYKIKPKIINLVVSKFYVGGISTNLSSLREGMKRSWQLHKKEKYYPNIFLRILFNLRVILYSIIFNK